MLHTSCSQSDGLVGHIRFLCAGVPGTGQGLPQSRVDKIWRAPSNTIIARVNPADGPQLLVRVPWCHGDRAPRARRPAAAKTRARRWCIDGYASINLRNGNAHLTRMAWLVPYLQYELHITRVHASSD